MNAPEPTNQAAASARPFAAAELVRRGESLTVEFKSDRKCLPDRELVEALAAMANSQGGVLLLGVEDDGTVTISSPGGPIEGITTETLLTAAPRSRNPLLADAVKRIGLAERTGRGIDRIYEGVLRNGRPAPDFSATNEATFSVTMAAVPADLSFVRKLQDRPDHGVGLKADALLEIVKEHPIETPMAQVSTPDRQEDSSQHPLSNEGRIVAYVREHGKIATREAQAICGISRRATRTALEHLCKTGFCVQREKQGMPPMSCVDVFGRIWLDWGASNHVLVGFWSAFGRIWSVLVGCRHNSGFWTDNSGICPIILFPAALLRFIEVLLRPAILLYQGGVSEVCQRCIKRHDYGTISAGNGVIWRDLAGSGVIYGPLWPARGPLMAVALENER